MDKNYIDMHLLVDRYLQGILSDAEEAEFEERLVWDQELVVELDLAERLREGLQKSFADEKYAAKGGETNILGRLFDLLIVPQYAAAASFLLAVTLTVGVLLNPLMPDSNDSSGQATPTEFIPLLALRSSTAPTIHINEDAWTVLLVDVVGSYDSYRVTVRRDDPDAEPVWRQDQLIPTYLGALAVGMPGDSLMNGDYVLSIEGARESGTGESNYEFIQDLPFISAIAD
jgi:hypothetical protein